MRAPKLVLVVLVVVLLVVVVPGGGVYLVTKALNAVKGRRAVFAAVRDEFLRQLAELRPDLSGDAQMAAARIVAAQAVVETGGGVTPAWLQGYNFGNVTAGASWTGPVVEAGDLEYRAGQAAPVRIAARFRRYESLGAAVSDFFRVLNWPRYRLAREALFAGNASLYAERLRNDDPTTAAVEGGYYTAPLAEYRYALTSVLAGLA